MYSLDKFFTRTLKENQVAPQCSPSVTSQDENQIAPQCSPSVTSQDTPGPSGLSSEKRPLAKENGNVASSLSSEEEDLTIATNEKKKKKYTQKFRIEERGGEPFCKACNVKLIANFNHLKRHEGRKRHVNNFKLSKSSIKLDKYVNAKHVTLNKKTKSGELKLVMFLHEHRLPFILMDHLPQLIRSVCPDSEIAKQIKCGRTRATELTKRDLAGEASETLLEEIKISKYYSLLIDESTDVSCEKCLVVVIRFCYKSRSCDRFLGIRKVTDASADGLYKLVRELLTEKKIDIENIIGFGADNVSVMMGHRRGVQARFKEVNPDLIVMGCICHSMHLCASASAEKLPKSIEEFVRGVYNQFAHSPKRTDEFKEFQKFVNIQPLKLLKPSQTRWLSLEAAVNRIIHCWDALILYFTHTLLSEDLRSTRSILENLRNPIYKLYFFFLSYILGIINRINLEFQSEGFKVDVLLPRLRELFRIVLKNFMKKDYIDKTPLHQIIPDNPRQYLLLEDIYCGAQVDVLLMKDKNIDKQEVEKFRKNVLAYYVELILQIKKRIDFNDALLNYLGTFSPKIAVSGSIRSIVKILTFFPSIEVDVESLNTEWMLLSEVEELKLHENDAFEDFWHNVTSRKNSLDEPMFPNLAKIINAILCLPHSSA